MIKKIVLMPCSGIKNSDIKNQNRQRGHVYCVKEIYDENDNTTPRSVDSLSVEEANSKYKKLGIEVIVNECNDSICPRCMKVYFPDLTENEFMNKHFPEYEGNIGDL